MAGQLTRGEWGAATGRKHTICTTPRAGRPRGLPAARRPRRARRTLPAPRARRECVNRPGTGQEDTPPTEPWQPFLEICTPLFGGGGEWRETLPPYVQTKRNPLGPSERFQVGGKPWAQCSLRGAWPQLNGGGGGVAPPAVAAATSGWSTQSAGA
eukprot:gene25877-biopygen21029